MCPHCIAMGIVAFVASLPVISYGVKWIKSKAIKCKGKQNE